MVFLNKRELPLYPFDIIMNCLYIISSIASTVTAQSICAADACAHSQISISLSTLTLSLNGRFSTSGIRRIR